MKDYIYEKEMNLPEQFCHIDYIVVDDTKYINTNYTGRRKEQNLIEDTAIAV